MKSFLVRELFAPMVARLGTALASALVTYVAVHPDAANAVGAGLVAAIMIGVDLVTGRLLREGD